MLTAAEYAEKAGRKVNTVLIWCRKGLIPGAFKAKINGHDVYQIQENAPVLQPKRGHQPDPCNRPEPIQPSVKTYTQREICGFIARNCGKMTYGQISWELGIPTLEVRRIYEQLHDAYGI